MRVLNLVGQRFGKLVVIGDAPMGNGYHKRWTCRCDCGRISTPRSCSLRNGGTKSCGRHYPSHRRCRLVGDIASFNFHFLSYRSGAERRDIGFTLSKHEFRVLTSRDCEYCGEEPRPIRQSDARDDLLPYMGNGVDRVNNALGYSFSNCVPCCTLCNRMKSNMTQGEFLGHIQKISSYPKVFLNGK